MENITLRYLTIDDEAALTEMYRRAEITKDNYKEKLSDSENSFKYTGGMFQINDKKRNIEILSSENDVVIGGECDGVLCGMIWYNLFDTNYPFDKIVYDKDKLHYKKIIEKELRDNKIFIGKEIIVLPEAKGCLAYPLFHELLKKAGEWGAHYKTGEVYRVDGYKDETGFHPLELLNLPSYNTLMKTGGVPIGHSPQRTIVKDNITYYATPLVFVWEVESSLKTVEKILSEKKGNVYEI